MRIYNKLKLKPLKRQLRRDSTKAERIVWNLVRNRQIGNLKFLRQSGVGNFILDFYCPKLKFAIEIDGGHHSDDEVERSDALRTKYLNSFGIKVLRFWNNDVLYNSEGVYKAIVNSIEELLPSSSLSKEEE
ncbi:MAG: endonuclease domain-containing protein [Deltaproteobacteria bacterium]|nr:endonuclease domain-containing protein [Deltaproteobacteria bacterium]